MKTLTFLPMKHLLSCLGIVVGKGLVTSGTIFPSRMLWTGCWKWTMLPFRQPEFSKHRDSCDDFPDQESSVLNSDHLDLEQHYWALQTICAGLDLVSRLLPKIAGKSERFTRAVDIQSHLGTKGTQGEGWDKTMSLIWKKSVILPYCIEVCVCCYTPSHSDPLNQIL